MTWYPDGAASTSLEAGCAPHVVTTDGLEPPHGYPQKSCDGAIHETLWHYVRHPVLETRGWNTSSWCSSSALGPFAVQCGDQTVRLGTVEIRVFGPDGTIYAAPDLIYHYVMDHQYRPLHAFIDALLHGPQPGTDDYQALLARYGWD